MVSGILKLALGDAMCCADNASVGVYLIVCVWSRQHAVMQAAEALLLCLSACSDLVPHKQELQVEGLARQLMMDRLQFLLQVAAPCLKVAPEVCSIVSSIWLQSCKRAAVYGYRTFRAHAERLASQWPTSLISVECFLLALQLFLHRTSKIQ